MLLAAQPASATRTTLMNYPLRIPTSWGSISGMAACQPTLARSSSFAWCSTSAIRESSPSVRGQCRPSCRAAASPTAAIQDVSKSLRTRRRGPACSRNTGPARSMNARSALPIGNSDTSRPLHGRCFAALSSPTAVASSIRDAAGGGTPATASATCPTTSAESSAWPAISLVSATRMLRRERFTCRARRTSRCSTGSSARRRDAVRRGSLTRCPAT